MRMEICRNCGFEFPESNMGLDGLCRNCQAEEQEVGDYVFPNMDEHIKEMEKNGDE